MDWASLSGKLYYPYAEALRLALVERCTAVGYTVPTILQSALDATSGFLLPNAWLTAFHTALWDLLIYYWRAGTTGGWSEAAMLTQIGAASNITPGVGRIILASMLEQWYAVLNVLTTSFIAFSAEDADYHEWRGASSGVSYADAVSQFNSASWLSTPASLFTYLNDFANYNHYSGVSVFARASGPSTWELLRTRAAYTFAIPTTAYSHTWRLFHEVRSLNTPLADYLQYDDGIDSVAKTSSTASVLVEHAKNDTPSNSSSHQLLCGDISTVNLDESDAGVGETVGWRGTTTLLAINWNVTGGFAFVA